MAATTHVQRVRILYKTILRLHRGLPAEIQSLGDSYVRDEFRRHKKCVESEAIIFLHEWTVSRREQVRLCHIALDSIDVSVMTIRFVQSIDFAGLRGLTCGTARVKRSSHWTTARQIPEAGGHRETARRASAPIVRIDGRSDGKNGR